MYEYDVVYKAGKTNVNADSLSRNPVDSEKIGTNEEIFMIEDYNRDLTDNEIIVLLEDSNNESDGDSDEEIPIEEDFKEQRGKEQGDLDTIEQIDESVNVRDLNRNRMAQSSDDVLEPGPSEEYPNVIIETQQGSQSDSDESSKNQESSDQTEDTDHGSDDQEDDKEEHNNEDTEELQENDEEGNDKEIIEEFQEDDTYSEDSEDSKKLNQNDQFKIQTMTMTTVIMMKFEILTMMKIITIMMTKFKICIT